MNKNFALVIVLVYSGVNIVFGQVKVTGDVKNAEGSPLPGVHISLESADYFGITDRNGVFEIENVDPGIYNIVVTHLGAKTYRDTLQVGTEKISLSVLLEDDLLNLQNVVVTGTFEPRTQLESNTAITVLESNTLGKVFSRGTADLLRAIPGTFTDPSAGEVFTRVYSRGISAAAEDDLGWYYVSLQEDGLPVSLVQHSYYGPDIFHRLDLTTKKVEAVRGGSASITALNAPGGIYNFISHGLRKHIGGEFEIQGGVQGEENPLFRIDGTIGGPWGNNWFFNAGGHYRRDDGARNTPFTFSEGGQFKFNVTKKNNHGHIKFYGKILDDFTNRYTGVAAVDWDSPLEAFGQDFNTTALLMPAFKANIPDGRDLAEGRTNSFDPSRGVHAQDLALGIDFFQDIGRDWSISYKAKYSRKKADWQTSISNAFVSLNDPLAYFISGAQFPIGQVVFKDAQSGTEVARIDNSAILTGDSFTYVGNGTLPNDAIMGTSAWYKQSEANEWIDRLTFRKKWKNHDLNLGIASGFSNTSLFTQGSFAYVTYEPNPRMLQVTLENPGEPVIALSDDMGVSNYGGLFYINSEAKVSQLASFVNDRWKIHEKLYLDLGIRYEAIKHKGKKDRFAPFQQNGGLDSDPTTAYDNGILASTGEEDNFDFNYDYLSYSFGINHSLDDEAAIFGRFSSGNKAPELNYYFNNFSNVPINQKGEVQKIKQAELGLKWSRKSFSTTTTFFWSQLKDIGTTNFEFDPDDGSIFYTPVQFNDSRTFGLELESAYSLTSYLTLRLNGTFQNAEATKWTVYDAAGTVGTDDDTIVDFSGNVLPFNPDIMFNLGAEYEQDKLSAYLRWQFMGAREGNVGNAFQLPAYSIFNFGLGYALSQRLSVNLLVTNLFNSEGLANFFGANSFGANANGITAQFIQENPDASFVVVPVLPRGTMLKLNYHF
ncbi:TonB-dependent receptor [Spongiimicrobium sp. 3-5]|uniref:TonB-dependent receptor n=1 Tax=Spongiimicrobium sp. 3-5 TaxID=3332596 RepID=UPI00397EA805